MKIRDALIIASLSINNIANASANNPISNMDIGESARNSLHIRETKLCVKEVTQKTRDKQEINKDDIEEILRCMKSYLESIRSTPEEIKRQINIIREEYYKKLL